MRFVAGGRRLTEALKAILPQSKGEWALRLGPEAGFALISAAMAPEGTSLGSRLGLAAEDMLIGTTSSFLGSGLGLAGGKGLYGRSGGEKAAQLGEELYKQKLSQAMTAGDILAAPLPMFAPRPVAEDVYRQAMEGQSNREQEALIAQEQERLMQEALLNSVLTGGGALLMPGSQSLLS
jgi:hypothetical protein